MNIISIARKIKSRLLELRYPIRALKSIFWTYKARRKRSFRNEIIYDIGMHEGQDTSFYLKKGFRVIAVEANSALVDSARKRFAPFLMSGQLTILNVGVASKDSDKYLEFFVNEQISDWSSFDKKLAGRMNCPLRSVYVPTRTLASIVTEFGSAHHVKIDIEGHDVIALRSLLDNQERPCFVSVENGNQGMLGMLIDADYNRFKYIQQEDITKVRLPKEAKEGEYTEHLFPRGASGPFGEETQGEWLTAEQVRLEISKVWEVASGEKKPGDHGWYDLHAHRMSSD